MKSATQSPLGLIGAVGILFVCGMYKALRDKIFGFCAKFFWYLLAIVALAALLENIGWAPITSALTVVGKVLLAILFLIVLVIGALATFAYIRERQNATATAKPDNIK